jgi:hypothetical protein
MGIIMKYRIFSDIHQEVRRYVMGKKYTPWYPEPMEGDLDTILILAGDIDHAKQVPGYLNTLAPLFKAVIHVSGNHEFYGSNLISCGNKFKEAVLAPNVYHLENQVITIDGQKFVGCTMWTNLQGREPEVMRVMNDYKQIRLGAPTYRKLTPMDTTYIHFESQQFLHNNVCKDTIVITHHSPLSPGNSSLGGFNPYGRQPSDTDYAYHACQEEFIMEAKPKAWISGHTHEILDNQFFDTRLIVNCIGYCGEEGDYQEGVFNIA